MPSNNIPTLPLKWGRYHGLHHPDDGSETEDICGYYGVTLTDKQLQEVERLWGGSPGSAPVGSDDDSAKRSKELWVSGLGDLGIDMRPNDHDQDSVEWLKALDPHTVRCLIEMAWKAREAGVA